MTKIWANLSIAMQRFILLTGSVTAVVVIGLQFHVSSQGDMSATYPKGFRGGTCTIESDALLIGYSGYFIPEDYEIPADAMVCRHDSILAHDCNAGRGNFLYQSEKIVEIILMSEAHRLQLVEGWLGEFSEKPFLSRQNKSDSESHA